MIDRNPLSDARIERALADLDQRLIAAQRRERRAIAIGVFACIVAITGRTPLAGQAPKTIEERIDDLEKRTGGFQVDGGTTRVTAPLEIYDNRGRMIAAFTTADNGGHLVVGGAEKGFALIGTSSDGGGIVRLYGANRKMSLHAGSMPGVEGRGVFLMDSGGNAAQASLTIDGDNLPNLEIGSRDRGSVRVTVVDGGPGVVSVRDERGVPGMVIGSLSNSPLGLYALGDNRQPVASFRKDKLGGRIQIHNLRGDPVGGLFSEFTGGGLVLTDENGGHSLVDLGVRGGGGSIRVFSVGGGPARAAMETDDKIGAFTVYASDGDAAASLASRPGGSGYFQLLYNGITMVDAGMNEDNVGIVRAGPSSQKTVGVLSIPYRLVGRK
jgi:hypothetical protein